jgi:monofunctional biosynthetic peptidoglycan transglycosylase
MPAIVLAVAAAMMLSTNVGIDDQGDAHVIFDFTASPPWASIDDVVMGGVSQSRMVIEDGVAVFRGVLSLENNGGFASVRSRPADHDLSGHRAIVLRVKGDGNRYKLRLRTSSSFDGVSYEAPLEPGAGEWQDLTIPLDAFRATYRGRLVRDYPALDPSGVKTFGIMIADKQEGSFRLEVASISAVR